VYSLVSCRVSTHSCTLTGVPVSEISNVVLIMSLEKRATSINREKWSSTISHIHQYIRKGQCQLNAMENKMFFQAKAFHVVLVFLGETRVSDSNIGH
jgi:hypothetical protein